MCRKVAIGHMSNVIDTRQTQVSLPHTTPRHLNRILQTWLTHRLKFVSICDSLQYILWITYASSQYHVASQQNTSSHIPDISPIRSPIPALMPTIPTCPNGFWSNHSVTNSLAYCNMRSNLVGRMSRSAIAEERSKRRIK